MRQAARICEVGEGIKEYQADSGRWTVSALEAAGVEFTNGKRQGIRMKGWGAARGLFGWTVRDLAKASDIHQPMEDRRWLVCIGAKLGKETSYAINLSRAPQRDRAPPQR